MMVGPTLDSMRHRGHRLQLQHRHTVPHGVLPPADAVTQRSVVQIHPPQPICQEMYSSVNWLDTCRKAVLTEMLMRYYGLK